MLNLIKKERCLVGLVLGALLLCVPKAYAVIADGPIIGGFGTVRDITNDRFWVDFNMLTSKTKATQKALVEAAGFTVATEADVRQLFDSAGLKSTAFPMTHITSPGGISTEASSSSPIWDNAVDLCNYLQADGPGDCDNITTSFNLISPGRISPATAIVRLQTVTTPSNDRLVATELIVGGFADSTASNTLAMWAYQAPSDPILTGSLSSLLSLVGMVFWFGRKRWLGMAR